MATKKCITERSAPAIAAKRWWQPWKMTKSVAHEFAEARGAHNCQNRSVAERARPTDNLARANHAAHLSHNGVSVGWHARKMEYERIIIIYHVRGTCCNLFRTRCVQSAALGLKCQRGALQIPLSHSHTRWLSLLPQPLWPRRNPAFCTWHPLFASAGALTLVLI